MKRRLVSFVVVFLGIFLLSALTVSASVRNIDGIHEKVVKRATNKPLESLRAAAEHVAEQTRRTGPPREVENYVGKGIPGPVGVASKVLSSTFQDTQGTGETTVESGFYGTNNDANGTVLGFRISPPDTDGAVGSTHYVQMINCLTTIFDKSGNVELGPVGSNAFWDGMGGNCEPNNQGDPIVLYDDVNDRWLISQFAFPDTMSSYSQCVAISQTNDPTGAYNRYEFPFDSFGFNDYPKHGIVTDSITITANIFTPRGRSFSFGGSFLGVMDKNAMYAGQPASMIGFNIGTAEFGFVAGDLDGSGLVPALFATAMSTAGAFDIWKVDVDWSTENASVGKIASIPVTAFSSALCSDSRGACIPQPDGGPSLESLSDRLMHRLQIRDFGTYRTMVAAHTIDVGAGRAGLRWYEFRESNDSWSMYQEGTFGPSDGEYRWMPSIAMNAAGDIGLGYMVASTSTYVSPAVVGQTAANSGTGFLDSAEAMCAAGTGVQTGVSRSGDYSATSVDPATGNFWHTNEIFTTTGDYEWATYVCEFSIGEGGAPVNQSPTASFTYSCTDLGCTFDGGGSSDSDGSISSYAWTFGDGATGSGVTTSHTYAVAGSYSVTLTVTDDGGATGSSTQTLSVTAPPTGGDITLAATGYKYRGVQNVDLSWTGATSANIDVYRDGTLVVTTANDGAYTDQPGLGSGDSYVYTVCDEGSSTCSNEVTVSF